MNKKIAFPPIGIYTKPLENMLRDLGCENLLEQMLITQQMIDKGCKHSSDMMCFPYKVTLGYFMEALDRGAEILLMFDSSGQCRLKHYSKLQNQALREMGYKNFKLVPFKGRNLIKSFKMINNKVNMFQMFNAIRHTWKDIRQLDIQQIQNNKFNIGIIGEIYCCMEPALNFNIEKKIRTVGMNPYNEITMKNFLKGFLRIHDNYFKHALKYFNGRLGGHGIENVASTLKMIDMQIDGIIWFRPLSCMPETTVDPIIKSLCDKNNMPLLVIDIDETSAEANVSTRIETFFELIQTK